MRKMSNYDSRLIDVINEMFGSHNEFIEKFFPDMTCGELALEMYNAGLIPTDLMESILDEDPS